MFWPVFFFYFWIICDISNFWFSFSNKSHKIIKHWPKTQLKSSLIDVKLMEKPYFKGPTPGPDPGIYNFLPNFNFFGQKSHFFWSKKSLFWPLGGPSARPRRRPLGTAATPRHMFAHILALALAPGGALPPQTGACHPPCLWWSHMKAQESQKRRAQKG